VLRLAAVVSVWIFAACRRGDSPPQAPSVPASNTPVQVTGTESIAWDQVAKDAVQLAHYQYIVYIDDLPADPVRASCGADTGNGRFTCRIKLPKMQPGRHRLQLAVEDTDNQNRPSLKSNEILLDVAAPQTP
jgi:hypothetical protein